MTLSWTSILEPRFMSNCNIWIFPQPAAISNGGVPCWKTGRKWLIFGVDLEGESLHCTRCPCPAVSTPFPGSPWAQSCSMGTGREGTTRRTRNPSFSTYTRWMTVLPFVGGREKEFQGCKSNWGVKEGTWCKMSLFATQISLSGEGFPTEQKLYLQCLSKLGLLGHSLWHNRQVPLAEGSQTLLGWLTS